MDLCEGKWEENNDIETERQKMQQTETIITFNSFAYTQIEIVWRTRYLSQPQKPAVHIVRQNDR